MFRTSQAKLIKKLKPKASKNPRVNNHSIAYFFLLLLGAYTLKDLLFASQCKIDLMTIHGEPVTPLTSETVCGIKTSGASWGKICDVDEKTYYLKDLSCQGKTYFLKDLACQYEKSGSELISFEEYNRRFATRNLNITTPETRFFKGENFYIGSKNIEGLLFTNSSDDSEAIERKISKIGIAKLMVASTFIRDLHSNNWGYVDGNLVLIDVDSAIHNPLLYIPKTIKDYLKLAMRSMRETPIALTLDTVKEMKKIYENLQYSPLPKWHEEFEQSQQTHFDLLKKYIDCCEKTITKIEQGGPTIDPNKPNLNINKAFMEELTEASCQESYFCFSKFSR